MFTTENINLMCDKLKEECSKKVPDNEVTVERRNDIGGLILDVKVDGVYNSSWRFEVNQFKEPTFIRVYYGR